MDRPDTHAPSVEPPVPAASSQTGSSFDVASLSRTGGRALNEDYADVLQLSGVSCWIVADGLGGHRGGDAASRTVVQAALASFRDDPAVSAEAVAGHVARAQAALLAAQQADAALAQMRSTIVMLVGSDRECVWAHVGDSRLYHLRGGRVVTRTRDHSVSQALVDGGRIGAHEQGAHEDRSRLLRSLGKEGEAAPAVSGPHALAREDAFLLCTDGFWEAIDEVALELDLAGSEDAAGWLSRLEARLRRSAGGSHDNYTATAIRFTSPTTPLPSAPATHREPAAAPTRAVQAPISADPQDAVASGPGPRTTLLAVCAVIAIAVAAGIWQRQTIAGWVRDFLAIDREVPPPADPRGADRPDESARPPEDATDRAVTPGDIQPDPIGGARRESEPGEGRARKEAPAPPELDAPAPPAPAAERAKPARGPSRHPRRRRKGVAGGDARAEGAGDPDRRLVIGK